MNSNITDLRNRVEQFCSSPSSLLSNENVLLLTDIFKALFTEADCKNRNQLLQMIGVLRLASETSTTVFSISLGLVAFAAYDDRDDDFAEFMFRYACDLDDSNSNRNNLAYMLRRNKSGLLNSHEIILLLLPGVKSREPYCLTNMGLCFALCLSTPDDWKSADELFSLMPDEIHGVVFWWEQLGVNNEIEGFLVHFFLLRHCKITHSKLGSIKYLAWKIKSTLGNFPVWLSEPYRFDSLDDAIQSVDGVNSDGMIEEYLESMPHTRDSVNKIIEAWKHNKIRQLYDKLISDYGDILAEDEKAKIEFDYKNIFDNPFATKLVSIEDVSKCLSEVSSQEDFNYLHNLVIRISEKISFSSEETLWGRLLHEIIKNSNTQYVVWLVNWFQNDDDKMWWPLIPVNRVFAEILRLSCQFNRPECIDILRDSGANYADIQEECWDEPCVAYDKEDDEHSSPLAFAIDSNAKNCYMTILQWIHETNSDSSKEGKYVWISSETKSVFTEVPELLKNKDLDWPLSIG